MTIDKTAFSTRSILNGAEAIHYAYHDEDGDWQFLPNREVSSAEALVVGVDQVVSVDPTIREVLSMPAGSVAEKGNDGKWNIKIGL